jgi:hypothetical protein
VELCTSAVWLGRASHPTKAKITTKMKTSFWNMIEGIIASIKMRDKIAVRIYTQLFSIDGIVNNYQVKSGL